MRVFLSWSGERSRKIAEAMREWLPSVLQNVTLWMSEHDVDKGSRWATQIAEALDSDNFGLACLTPENLESPWINYETGALSKAVEKSRVWTYLFDLTPTDVTWPLAQFQHTIANREDTKKLVYAINKATSNSLPDQVLEKTYDKWWPDLDRSLAGIPPPAQGTPKPRDLRDVLNEVLELVRGISQATAAPQPTQPQPTSFVRRPLVNPIQVAQIRSALLKAITELTPRSRARMLQFLLPLFSIKEGVYFAPPPLEKLRDEMQQMLQQARAEVQAAQQQPTPTETSTPAA